MTKTAPPEWPAASVDVLAELLQKLPSARVLHARESVDAYAHDDAEWAPYGSPVAVVRARSAEDVQIVVRTCYEHGVAVVPRGAGTGLSGGANAVHGCVVVSLTDMDEILEINPVERLAVVQPGVINDDLRAAVSAHGLWYPPDPASAPWSTLGGNVATNAGGLCCVKYGVTRDYVLQLEVITGTGERVRVGRRTAKGVAGYDLAALMVGSEGTLGIVTEITVRLRALPPDPITIAGFFSSVGDAGEAVRAVASTGIVPSALELIDRHCLEAVDNWKNMGLRVSAEVVLLARVDDPGATAEVNAETIVGAFRRSGATWAERSSDAQESEVLFQARRLAYPALERLGPVLTEDVCVPMQRVPEMLERIEAIALANDVLIANIAHAGDGNLHPLIVTEPGDDAARARAQVAFEQILDAAIDVGGTITGEHGVGLLKQLGLGRELSEPVLEMHRAIKTALDPGGILNPGKVFPDIADLSSDPRCSLDQSGRGPASPALTKESL